MNDLIVASTILGALCLLAFTAGLYLGRYHSSQTQRRVGLFSVLLMGVYMWLLWDRPILAQLMPDSALIILANWLPIWGSLFVGIYAASSAIAVVRRMLLTSATVLLVAYSAVAPVFGTAPVCDDSAAFQELVHQSTPFTCSPAAAASLLRLHGIPATESELATLCLTREGTHWHGLYRGLRLKTQGTKWKVNVQPFSMDSLDRIGSQPSVLAINIDTNRFSDTVDHGFLDMMGHSVVLLRRNGPTTMTVFDPSPDYGVEIWGPSILDCVTGGVVLSLEPERSDVAAIAEVRLRTARVSVESLTAGL